MKKKVGLLALALVGFSLAYFLLPILFSPVQSFGEIDITWSDPAAAAPESARWNAALNTVSKLSFRHLLEYDQSGVYLFEWKANHILHNLSKLPLHALSDLTEDLSIDWNKIKQGEFVPIWQLPSHRFGLGPEHVLLNSSQLYIDQKTGEIVVFLFFSEFTEFESTKTYSEFATPRNQKITGIAYSITLEQELFRFSDTDNDDFEKIYSYASDLSTRTYRFIDGCSFAKIKVGATQKDVSLEIETYSKEHGVSNKKLTRKWSEKSDFPFVPESTSAMGFEKWSSSFNSDWRNRSIIEYSLVSVLDYFDSEYARLMQDDKFSTDHTFMAFGNYNYWIGTKTHSYGSNEGSKTEGLHLVRNKFSSHSDEPYDLVAKPTSLHRFSKAMAESIDIAAMLFEMTSGEKTEPVELFMKANANLRPRWSLEVLEGLQKTRTTPSSRFLSCQHCKKWTSRRSLKCDNCKMLKSLEHSIKLDLDLAKNQTNVVLLLSSRLRPPFARANVDCEVVAYPGSTISPRITIYNDGKSALREFWAILTFDGVQPPVLFAFGDVSKGDSVTESKKVRLPKNLQAGELVGKVEFFEYRGHEPPQHQLEIKIKPYPRDDFQVSWSIVDDGTNGSVGNGDGLVQPGELIGFVLEVTNSSESTVSFSAKLTSAEGIKIIPTSNRHTVESGKKYNCSIGVRIPADYASDSIPITMELSNDLDVLYFSNEKVDLSIRK